MGKTSSFILSMISVMVVLSLAGDKELKPVSFRVREAAEGLLTVIMEHLVCHPGINGIHNRKDGDC